MMSPEARPAPASAILAPAAGLGCEAASASAPGLLLQMMLSMQSSPREGQAAMRTLPHTPSTSSKQFSFVFVCLLLLLIIFLKNNSFPNPIYSNFNLLFI